MIEARELTKTFGTTTAVDRLSFSVQPGVVTGFLGPNGAGKSTTMRMILGLDRPTSGSVTVAGRNYADLPAPMHEVGALLEAGAVEGVRSARAHLSWLAKAGGVSATRVEEVLGLVGLTEVADRKIKGFSLGMSQRLGIAAALLGDPPVLLFDEPVNGLDPEGIHWVRLFMRHLASQGRTVIVSSHLMTEMEATADHVIVIGRGKLIADTTMVEFKKLGTGGGTVRVVTPEPARLLPVLQQAGATVTPDHDGAIIVSGIDNIQVATLAAQAGVLLHELTPKRATLEDTFMELTHSSVEYRTDDPNAPMPAAPIGAAR